MNEELNNLQESIKAYTTGFNQGLGGTTREDFDELYSDDKSLQDEYSRGYRAGYVFNHRNS
jgi:hypothetical protein